MKIFLNKKKPKLNCNFIFKKKNIADSQELFSSLVGNGYLETDYVDGYLNYLKLVTKFKCDFLPSLGLYTGLSDRKKRILKEAKYTFIPIIHSSHWTLGVALNETKEIHYWDSLGRGPTEFSKKHLEDIFPGYPIINCSRNHQSDGANCGMFLIYYATHYATSGPNAARNRINKDQLCTSQTMFILRKIVAAAFHPSLFQQKYPDLSFAIYSVGDSTATKKKNSGAHKTESSSSKSRKKSQTSSSESKQKGSKKSSNKQLDDKDLEVHVFEAPSQQTVSVLEALEKMAPNLPSNVKDVLLFSAIHQIKKAYQNEAFRQPLTNPRAAKMLMDFKSNLSIGMTCEQECQQYYNLSHRQLLGIWVLSQGKEMFIDVLSEDLTKDSNFVEKAVRTVFQLSEFKALNLNEIEIWSDGAAHFRNK